MSGGTSTARADASHHGDHATAEQREHERRKEIYTYKAPALVYAMHWSPRPDPRFRLAIGSFVEEYANTVEVVQLNEETGEFDKTAAFDHPYPPTKLMWLPDQSGSRPDLMATTGDYLRMWLVNESRVRNVAVLHTKKSSEFCAPLTSFDWNETAPNLIGTSSIDTTCTIWNIETQTSETQLIAHDKEVYDICWAPGSEHLFATVGADGSVRMFDLRQLEHSTIIYESQNLTPLLRLAWNRLDPNYLCTATMDSTSAIVIDRRVPSIPVAELQNHSACINSISWAPHSSCHLCTGADDSNALIWDLSLMPKPVEDPILAYSAGAEITAVHWPAAQCEFVSIAFADKLQILRV